MHGQVTSLLLGKTTLRGEFAESPGDYHALPREEERRYEELCRPPLHTFAAALRETNSVVGEDHLIET